MTAQRDEAPPQAAAGRRRWWPPASRRPRWPSGWPPPTGTWRWTAARGRLRVTVEPFGSLPATARGAVQAEAERLAPFRGATTAEVTVPAQRRP